MKIQPDTEPAKPTIVESYHDFRPPDNFRQIIEELVSYVPAKYLLGLRTIILTNSSAMPRDRRKQKVWSRNHRIRLAEAAGSYSHETGSSPATVWLHVDIMTRGVPAWMAKWPLLRYTVPSKVLYHEIGHHIHAFHKPVYEGKENVAEDWSRKLRGYFLRKRYWYIFPFAHVIVKTIKLVKQIGKALGLTKTSGTGGKKPRNRS